MTILRPRLPHGISLGYLSEVPSAFAKVGGGPRNPRDHGRSVVLVLLVPTSRSSCGALMGPEEEHLEGRSATHTPKSTQSRAHFLHTGSIILCD